MRLCILGWLMITALSVQADGLRFGLVAKSTSDLNFVAAAQGCQEAAAADGNHCDLLGDEGTASPHVQRFAIEQAIASQRYQGLAISVTNSEFVAQGVAQSNIPILTFDSPFSKRHAHLSQGYVGTDNRMIGVDIGELALFMRPQGGTVCIMSVQHDPNLQQRVEALRQTLAADSPLMKGQRLNGENGWTELDRCPELSRGSNTNALAQIEGLMDNIKPDVILSVGHWPIEDPDAYSKVIRPYLDSLQSKQPLVIVAVGGVSEGYQRLLSERLIHGLVSINFEEIGKAAYQRMKEAASGRPIPETTFTPNRRIPPGSQQKKAAVPESSPARL